MGTNSSSSSQLPIPLFNGEKYQFWSVKMQTLFKPQDLWELVEECIAETDDVAKIKENKKKDAKALYLLQQAIHEDIFPTILSASSSREAWLTLQKEYRGDSKVITIRLQTLRREFETSMMKKDETIQDFLSRVKSIVSQMRNYGEKCSDHIVMSFDELMGSLQAHEARINRPEENIEEKAFHVKGEYASGAEDLKRADEQMYGKGRRKTLVEDEEEEELREFSATIANEGEEDCKAFMAWVDSKANNQQVWFLDSGCSHHMTGNKSLLSELDESYKKTVRLGDSKQLQVEGKGTVAMQNNHGKINHLYNVLYVSNLSQNLLSVGQLLSRGFTVTFDKSSCLVASKASGKVLVKASMTQNKLFPVDLTRVETCALIAQKEEVTALWHRRYGHININNLKMLQQKEMVKGMPVLGTLDICEACIYGKQSKKPFSTQKAWMATKFLELVHGDLCGPMQTETFGGTEKQSEKPVKALRTDKGGEFTSKDFWMFCEENGIHRELTTPYTPEQNGVAERKNRTVVEMARSMLQEKGLPNHFWGEAVATTVYILNISPTRAVPNQTPYEVWTCRRSQKEDGYGVKTMKGPCELRNLLKKIKSMKLRVWSLLSKVNQAWKQFLNHQAQVKI
ncbi:hypothetical protein GQ457_18G020990 [Hibiscus cannabinus]